SVPPATPLTTVSGVVLASDSFTSGTVNAYAFTGGAKAALLSTAAIHSDGAYHLTVPASSGAILIEAASGCYNEKAIPWITATYQYPSVLNAVTTIVCSTSPVLSAAVLVPAGATALVFAVTPYTHAAVGLAEYEIRNGSTVATAVNDANTRLSQWVGADIQTTLPTAPARSSTFASATLYGSLLSGIPSWLLNVATTSLAVFGAGDLTSLAFADAMKNDLAQDGVLDGVGRDASGNAVALQIGGVALTTSIYRHQLAFYAVIRVRAETEGALNSTQEEQARIVSFLPAFVAYNDATNSLLDASALVALDEGGPVITIGYPSPGFTLTNNNGMAGFVHDPVGILVNNTVMLIDGDQYTYFLNQYIPNHFINTTIFPNGAHVLTIKATNNLGHVSTASVTVNFLN
ncbi:MAG: hypothetical protein WAW75_00905, partial [Gallionella sp.]